MARVFTIAPGLENMGGLKTGGQGSIYKGRRIGEIITAIKILPTPIFSESPDDKNYTAFQSEVEKLKRVNEVPNPNVVKILSSGISEAGNFPYIEMEYIEGPDLEELLRSPDHSVFTINETLKVADQLSNALAHCHSVDVRHGDIKGNNVKLDVNSGNYVLLDFGLAIMSDEQRRSNLRQSGTIEFMAPEQTTGQMLFQTDIYSFGIILFELLAGTVPFQLKGKGETARNEVRLAHMASPVPNLLELRRSALPVSWDDQKKQREMQVPQWLVGVINRCLEKKPEKRFANGIELHNYIVQQFISKPGNTTARLSGVSVRPLLKEDLISHQEQLKKQLAKYREDLLKKEGELIRLKELLQDKEAGVQTLKTATVQTAQPVAKKNRVSRTSFVVLLFFTLALGAFAMYPIFKNAFLGAQTAGNLHKPITGSANSASRKNRPENVNENPGEGLPAQVKSAADGAISAGDSIGRVHDEQTKQGVTVEKATGNNQVDEAKENGEDTDQPTNQTEENENVSKNGEKPTDDAPDELNTANNAVAKKYLVVSKAYFYNEPDENTKRNEFISPAEKAVVQALNERYGFIYVVITNPQGQVFKGWLRKKELKLYSID